MDGFDFEVLKSDRSATYQWLIAHLDLQIVAPKPIVQQCTDDAIELYCYCYGGLRRHFTAASDIKRKIKSFRNASPLHYVPVKNKQGFVGYEINLSLSRFRPNNEISPKVNSSAKKNQLKLTRILFAWNSKLFLAGASRYSQQKLKREQQTFCHCSSIYCW